MSFSETPKSVSEAAEKAVKLMTRTRDSRNVSAASEHRLARLRCRRQELRVLPWGRVTPDRETILVTG